MGTIISSKKDGNNVILEILTDYEEFLQLRGHLNNIRLITENVAEVQTNISQRGKNQATKYFLIPRQFRKGFKFNNTTSCQRLDVKDKVLFIYVVNKLKVNRSKRELAIERLEEKEKKRVN
ncbi:MAG: hypothetical protein IIA85_02400 [Nanoarchaeota archaeon]|nr:hypothetical protein [Nanoarchaeota archaeon]